MHANKIAALNTLIRTYDEEVFNRDSDLMSRDSSIHVLQRQVVELRRTSEKKKSDKTE